MDPSTGIEPSGDIPPESYSHTAHYLHIESALKARWHTFVALEAEMLAFIPRPLADFEPERVKEINRLVALNPNKPVEEIRLLVERQIALLSSDLWQMHKCFDERHMADYAAVVMLAHALCEALINAVLAIGLARAKTADLFELLERADFLKKWLVGPKTLDATYHFPRGFGMHQTLLMLARQRNALVHHKIELELDGVKVLSGSGFERKPYAEEHIWLRRYFSLPYDLDDFLLGALRKQNSHLFFSSAPIERSPLNKIS